MKLALITGAGASTRLGKERPLPMMPQLSRTLHEALRGACAGLPEAVGLAPDMTGPAFESALGRLFQWRDSRHLNQYFSGLSFDPPPGPQARTSEMQGRWNHEDRHLRTLMRTIDETLFAEFGAPRIDADAAASAFGGMFDLLGCVDQSHLFCATTNYDPSLEMALGRLGMQPEMYPDPAKDPAEGITRDLWDLFTAFVLDRATHVLVLGHSLHDPPLPGKALRSRPH